MEMLILHVPELRGFQVATLNIKGIYMTIAYNTYRMVCVVTSSSCLFI